MEPIACVMPHALGVKGREKPPPPGLEPVAEDPEETVEFDDMA